ncbi:MAG: S8 family peptidase [Promethearchaeota archaeon]
MPRLVLYTPGEGCRVGLTGMLPATDEFGVEWRVIAELANFPVFIIESAGETNGGNTVKELISESVKGVMVEEDIRFTLSGKAINEILRTHAFENSIFGPFFGVGINIGIIDGGIDPLHPDLHHLAIHHEEFGSSTSTGEVDLGHGTAVAGVICGNGRSSRGRYRGLAPDVTLYDARVFNDDNSGWLSDVLRAIDWLHGEKVHIIAMAFNSPVEAGTSRIFEVVLQHLYEDDVISCCGAGNNGPADGSIGMPGCFESVLTTGTLNRDNNIHPTSGRGTRNKMVIGRGKKPDFCLPGINIISLNTEKSMYKDRVLDENEYYAIFSGNSISVAMLAGILAKVKSVEPHLNCDQIWELCIRSCMPILHQPKNAVGSGVLNPKRLFRELNKLYAPDSRYSGVLGESILTSTILMFFIITISIFIASFF